MAAGAGGPVRPSYPETSVEYDADNITTGVEYPWASADGSAAGILPLTVWTTGAGYFSYNPGSALLDYLLAVARIGGSNTLNSVKFEVTYTVPTASVIGRSNIVCRYTTPFASQSTNSNTFSLAFLMTDGANTVFKGSDTTPFYSIVSPAFCTDPDKYTIRLITPEPQVSGTLIVNITISGQFN
jgi:hypothetical protein